MWCAFARVVLATGGRVQLTAPIAEGTYSITMSMKQHMTMGGRVIRQVVPDGSIDWRACILPKSGEEGGGGLCHRVW